MANTRFIAGPWRADSAAPYMIRDRHRRPVAECPLYLGPDIERANAILIASAPDMLAALESAENALHNLTAHNVEADPIDLAALATVRAAIARAKGES